MKKTLILLLILALCMGILAACTGPQEDGTSTPSIVPSSSISAPSGSVDPSQPSDEIQVITIAEALEICGEPGNITTDRYYIRGIIQNISNATYGAMTIADETGEISIYGTYSADGTLQFSQLEDKPYKGDEVLLHCILQNYDGTKEIKNARLISFTHNEPDVDQTLYTDMSIQDVRNAEKGTMVKVDGVVAQITYAFGQVPTGIYLVDDTNSILIYDRDLAQRVQIGNKITVLATKTYWILDDEQSYADKFGYKGCCQLESAYLLENDDRTDNAYDHSWIQETTVKDLLNTSLSENITTSIVKVNALVERVQEPGFVNYRFYDLDGKTYGYTYTQCNGSDFAWLDAYDGKICTVYLSAINAKATKSDCFFRLQPIQVIDEGYQFDLKETGKHIVEYYGKDQFQSVYTGDPCLELITSVSSDLLGFTNAKLNYTSSNTSVIKFEESNGKVFLRANKTGTATITITGSYNGNSYSYSMDITIEGIADVDYISVKEAIDAASGTTVTIKGIVGPSVTNQSAFYLIDETGVIAVSMDSDQFVGLKIGQEVVIEGIRDIKRKDGATCFGQSHILNAKVISNAYGNQNYSTASFIQDKTLADFYALSNQEDHTTSVYVLKATITLVETQHYKNIYITSGDISVQLYANNAASQYAWLLQFVGQEVTLEIVPCNWNSKKPGTPYACCVLSVITEDGQVYNQFNFK